MSATLVYKVRSIKTIKMFIYMSTIHFSSNGPILIEDMTDQHLVNVLKLKLDRRLNKTSILPYIEELYKRCKEERQEESIAIYKNKHGFFVVLDNCIAHFYPSSISKDQAIILSIQSPQSMNNVYTDFVEALSVNGIENFE